MEFDIKVNIIEGMPEQIANYGDKVVQYKEIVEGISREINRSEGGFEELLVSMKQSIEKMEQQAATLGEYARGLEEIIRTYCNAENKLINQTNGGKAQSDSTEMTPEEKSQYEAYKKRIQEIYDKLLAKDGDYLGALELWKELAIKMHVENPSECTLTKEEKVAILMAIKPLVSKIDTKYDELAAENPFINNWVHDHVDFLNSDGANFLEKKAIELLSTNGVLQNILGFAYRENSNGYYTVEGCLQNQWGFCDYIDELGGTLGMDLDTDISTFKYDGQEFRIQLWKGHYGWDSAVGGEFAIYSRPEWEAKGDPYVQGSKASELTLYDAASKEYQLPVKQTTYYTDDHGRKKRFINDTSTYGDGDHFWNLNIRTEAGVDKSSISTEFEIDCSGKDYGFQEALYNSLEQKENLKVRQEGSKSIAYYE